MSNITELTQNWKAAAHKARQANDLYLQGKITLSECVAETKDYLDYSDNPNNLLALVEALEKSEKTSEARREAIDRTHNMFVRERDRANAAEEALEKAQQAALPLGLRLALSNAGIAAPESDEMLAATQDKYIQDLVIWVRDRKPFRSAPAVSEYPETLPCPVILEPGFRFGKGVGTHLVLRALKNRAERYAELDAMGPEAAQNTMPLSLKSGRSWALVRRQKQPCRLSCRSCRSSGSDAEWYQGFAAGAGSMREACAAALVSVGVEIIGETK